MNEVTDLERDIDTHHIADLAIAVGFIAGLSWGWSGFLVGLLGTTLVGSLIYAMADQEISP